MPEVPERLVPVPGSAISRIRFAGIDFAREGSVSARYDIIDEDDAHVDTFRIPMKTAPGVSYDEMVSRCHRQMCDMLRQWLYWMDQSATRTEERMAKAKR